jgi:alpha-ketoglutarate-dependent taurine dioxygenase
MESDALRSQRPVDATNCTDAVEWLSDRLTSVFPGASFIAPLGDAGFGCKICGVDLSLPLSPDQAALLVEAVPRFRVVCLGGQDITGGPGALTLQRVERLASHFGVVLPHPNNFLRGGKPAQADGVSAFECVHAVQAPCTIACA